MPCKRNLTLAAKEARIDGWTCASNGYPKSQRPNYQTYEEREAFDAAWEEKTHRAAMGYRDDQQA